MFWGLRRFVRIISRIKPPDCITDGTNIPQSPAKPGNALTKRRFWDISRVVARAVDYHEANKA